KVLMNQDGLVQTDVLIAVVDASNLKRNLLFCTQLIDLKLPVVVALTMTDLAKRKGININIPELERELGIPVTAVNPRKNKGITQLKKTIALTAENIYQVPARDFIDNKELAHTAIGEIQELFPALSDYSSIHYLINHESFDFPEQMQEAIESIEQKNNFNATKIQADEIMQRYSRIKHIMKLSVSEADPLQKTLFTERSEEHTSEPSHVKISYAVFCL